MALVCKLETEVEFKSSAEKMYNLIKGQNHHIPNVSNGIHAVDVHEGDWETSGSVKLWKYTVEEKEETFKEKVEIDDENKKVTLVCLEGHCLDHYKSYKASFKVTPKGESGVVAITLNYEKRQNDSPDANKYLQFLVNVIRDIDAYLIKDA
ncbi:hypothetical protein FEM48_Zijuj10G0124100 [Ziziphus jujuba var. spinosa]|uniref:Bet v I/Major latex protein domain-containing protein n=1 Tax=Ziziphus jujuba var. spinosa TaxID=714518 RepID=A0A978UND3_ZIZJJ|nr:hypothetical protein FEM48_Zijuj10G0124100 [Ziziphus jujuba var. spinosa]